MRKKRRKNAVMVPVASMGDIAFLLIIFFMVCSNFAKEAGVTLTPPKSPDVEQMPESKISVSIDEVGQIYLQGEKVPDAKAIEYGVSALLEQVDEEGSKVVLFKCDFQVDKSVFEPVIDAIAAAGGVIGAIGEKTGP